MNLLFLLASSSSLLVRALHLILESCHNLPALAQSTKKGRNKGPKSSAFDIVTRSATLITKAPPFGTALIADVIISGRYR